MERFYQGELFNLETQELVNMIKSIFIQSELRDNYIQEIIEFRNMS
ncbi:Retrograde transport protein Dsl1 C terminal [Chlamydia trachomatis]|nr:Retrograde transport protein Dsl1 C terminal [Chlamydia trachomatis]